MKTGRVTAACALLGAAAFLISQLVFAESAQLVWDDFTDTSMARWGDPEELVGTVLFLASTAADFITGQVVYVDGGILATI